MTRYRLLDYYLCRMGLLYPLIEQEKIFSAEIISSNEFTRIVLIAEGLAANANGEWFIKIKNKFEERFGKIASKTK